MDGEERTAYVFLTLYEPARSVTHAVNEVSAKITIYIERAICLPFR